MAVNVKAGAIDLPNNRVHTITRKVKTDFGSMYIHINYNEFGRPCGGWISDPGKEPDSQISKLVIDLAIGLNDALKDQFNLTKRQTID